MVISDEAMVTNGGQKKSGYILISILSILGFAYFIYQRIVNTSLLQAMQGKSFTSKEQAKLLVYTGFSCAMLKLTSLENGIITQEDNTLAGVSTKTTDTPQNITPRDRLKSFYFGIWPMLGTWQKIELTTEADGLQAEIFFCLTAEEGKLPLNDIFDTKKKEIKDEYKKFFNNLKLKNVKTQDGDFTKILQAYYQDQNNTDFLDVTQLPIKEHLAFFYEPNNLASAVKCKIIDAKEPAEPTKNNRASQIAPAKENSKAQKSDLAKETEIYLADLFRTVGTSDDGINPLLLTASMKACLGITSPTADFKSTSTAQKILEELDFTTVPTTATIATFLGIDAAKIDPSKTNPAAESRKAEKSDDSKPNSEEANLEKEITKEDKLASLAKMFTKNMDPQFFSLLALARYNDITQKALLIFKRQTMQTKYASSNKSMAGGETEKKDSNNKQENAQDEKKHANLYGKYFFIPDGFEVIRLYWL